MLSDYSGGKFHVGERWKYLTRVGEEASTIVVVKVETSEETGVIVHVSLEGLRVRNPRSPAGIASTVSHMPFAEIAVAHSVTEKVEDGAPLPDFQEGYDTWRESFDVGQGGVFTTSLAEGVGFLEQIVGQSAPN
ncbi:MAG: hypothetical protein ABI551_26445 [Polyangiaceae bacterium]